MTRASATTDHEVIRRWIESRKGHPSVVKSTEGRKRGSSGLLRVDFNEPENSLDEISWEEFFATFDENGLAFLYQEKTAAGRKSRFNKFVKRDSVEDTDASAESADDGDATSRREAGSTQASATDRKTGSKRPGKQAAGMAEEQADEDLEEADTDEDEDEDEEEEYEIEVEALDEDEEEDEEDEEDDRGRKRR